MRMNQTAAPWLLTGRLNADEATLINECLRMIPMVVLHGEANSFHSHAFVYWRRVAAVQAARHAVQPTNFYFFALAMQAESAGVDVQPHVPSLCRAQVAFL